MLTDRPTCVGVGLSVYTKFCTPSSATLPEYPLRPRRLYNIATFLIGALLLAGLIHLLVAIVRDHRD